MQRLDDVFESRLLHPLSVDIFAIVALRSTGQEVAKEVNLHVNVHEKSHDASARLTARIKVRL